MLISPFVGTLPVSEVSSDPTRKGGHAYTGDLVYGLIYLTSGDEYPTLTQEDATLLMKRIHDHKRGRFESCDNRNWLLCSCRFAKITRASDMLISNYWERIKIMEVL